MSFCNHSIIAGALKKAAENRKPIDKETGKSKRVAVSVIEAFGGANDNDDIPVRDVEDVLRMEYRSKLLNPKWRDAMLEQGSGGAYEVSQRMTAMVSLYRTVKLCLSVSLMNLYCSPHT